MELISFIALGILGALTRLVMQTYREKRIYQSKREALTELFLGAIAGYASFLLVKVHGWTNHLTALTLGFCAPDFLEAFFIGFKGKLAPRVGRRKRRGKIIEV